MDIVRLRIKHIFLMHSQKFLNKFYQNFGSGLKEQSPKLILRDKTVREHHQGLTSPGEHVCISRQSETQ